ncbi:MAG TPA: FkbM family methyltransferase [Tepidisphaeraceae bacterium]|jgi:FkbM family methyltransferase
MAEGNQPLFTPFNRLTHCRHGVMLYNINDTHIGQSLATYGEWCELEVEIFAKILRPGDVTIDVGANVGAHTVAMARLVEPRGTVIAFEPQRVVFQSLCANVANNSLPNVFCYQAAVGERADVMVVPPLDPNTRQNFGAFVISGYDHGEPVGVTRLDDLPLRACRLIKIDVEGMELAVLRGAEALIRNCSPILYVENNRPEHSEELIRFIRQLGFDLYWHEPPLFNPDNFLKHPKDIFDGERAQNMVCGSQDSGLAIEGLAKVQGA